MLMTLLSMQMAPVRQTWTVTKQCWFEGVTCIAPSEETKIMVVQFQNMYPDSVSTQLVGNRARERSASRLYGHKLQARASETFVKSQIRNQRLYAPEL